MSPGAANPSLATAERPVYPLVLLRAMRPKQWTKNLAAYAPLLFAHRIFQSELLIRATLAVVAFCLLASGVYVLNDWVDREKDALHPEKRKRPIAAGWINFPMAMALLVSCWTAGLGLAYLARPEFALVGTGYVVLQVLYCFALKQMVILDVMVIALGFLIRVAGGGVAVGVPLSNWLYLCTLLLALFLGFAKRRHELASLAADAASHRKNLSEYSLPMLDQLISLVAAACIVAYSLYTVAPDTVARLGSDHMKFTVPCVMYGLFRYLYLIHKKNLGGSPEKVLLGDAPLLADIGVFLAVALWALYF